jgi:hypothetical protein
VEAAGRATRHGARRFVIAAEPRLPRPRSVRVAWVSASRTRGRSVPAPHHSQQRVERVPAPGGVGLSALANGLSARRPAIMRA